MTLRKANRRSKRKAKASQKGTPFARIVYNPPTFANGVPQWDREWFKNAAGQYDVRFFRYKPKDRDFENYEAALFHLTNLRLGLEEEDKKWRRWTPVRLISGYKRGAREYIQETKELDTNERPSIRRPNSSVRLNGQWGTSVNSVSQTGTSTGNSYVTPTITWSDWPSDSSVTAVRVGA